MCTMLMNKQLLRPYLKPGIYLGDFSLSWIPGRVSKFADIAFIRWLFALFHWYKWNISIFMRTTDSALNMLCMMSFTTEARFPGTKKLETLSWNLNESYSTSWPDTVKVLWAWIQYEVSITCINESIIGNIFIFNIIRTIRWYTGGTTIYISRANA